MSFELYNNTMNQNTIAICIIINNIYLTVFHQKTLAFTFLLTYICIRLSGNESFFYGVYYRTNIN